LVGHFFEIDPVSFAHAKILRTDLHLFLLVASSILGDPKPEATAIRSMTRKADEARIRQEMAAAIAAYTGPVTKCPPGKARGGTGKVKLLIRPRYRAKPPPVTPPRR
jgi:hypothetical protein